MGKIGIIIDSTSSLSYEEATKKGLGYIPLIITVNGIDKKSGIDIFNKDIYRFMDSKDVKISTSLPLGKDIEDAFDKTLKKYEKVIYIGLSKKFSGTFNAVSLIAKKSKYEGKVFVYESKWSAPWTGLYLDEIIDIVNNAKDVQSIFDKLDLPTKWMVGYMSPKDTYWFYKGGRITKTQYLASTLLKVFPILTVIDGKIDQDSVVKSRTVNKATLLMCDMMKDKVDKLKEMNIPFTLLSLESENKISNDILVKSVEDYFDIPKKDIISIELSTEQTAHLGPGAFGLSLFVPIKGLVKK